MSTLHVPFQVTNCAVLKFKPIFSVSTAGKTSRAKGASLNVKLTYPKAAFGTQANIGKVKVNLPKQLPSRLTTLQKACPDSVFDANPASCPADSRIGSATATTPVLPVHLEGPAYFVCHGGAKFPELIVALSGEGVTVYLHGETFISKAGITSSTFRTIPDVPIGTFELKLPQGPDSALGGEREPLHEQARDAHDVRRRERREHQTVHSCHGDGMPEEEGQEGEEDEQAQEEEMRCLPREGRRQRGAAPDGLTAIADGLRA